jgi:hypothetical protein
MSIRYIICRIRSGFVARTAGLLVATSAISQFTKGSKTRASFRIIQHESVRKPIVCSEVSRVLLVASPVYEGRLLDLRCHFVKKDNRITCENSMTDVSTVKDPCSGLEKIVLATSAVSLSVVDFTELRGAPRSMTVVPDLEM